ncbi:MAG: hypothetical protein AAB456_02415 [Patescibacteria group bacterium]
MTIQETIDKLNTLQRYDEIENPRDFYRGISIQTDNYGEYVKLADVAALFNLMCDTWKGDKAISQKILPNT